MVAADGAARRTDPRTFAVKALLGLRNAVFPVIAMFFVLRDEGIGMLLALLFGLFMVGVAALRSYLEWSRFTYRVGAEDIRVESGILSRAARSVPYERIQDVSLEQALLPRLFGLVEVKFETGSGGGEDLKLSYLPESEGERLRELVRERREDEVASAPAQELAAANGAEEQGAAIAAGEPATRLFTMGPRRLLAFGMFEFSLAVVAVFFGLTQQFEFLLPFEIWDFDEWEQRLAGPGAYFAGLGPTAQIVGALFGVFSLLVVGFGTGIIRTFLRDWGFLLEKTPRGFRRRRGLFTRTDVVMPVHRVQAIQIGTRLLRYRFGWHSLKFVSLAQDAGSTSHVVAPFAKLAEIEPIVRAAGFHSPSPQLDWHRASKRYRFDRIMIESFPLLLGAAAAAAFAPSAYFLVPLAVAVLSAFANLYGWHFHRHALDEGEVFSTRGFLSPSTQIAKRVKLHSVEIAQGPIAQRRGYATLHMGLAGGSFSVAGVPLDHARAMREAILESIAATDYSQING